MPIDTPEQHEQLVQALLQPRKWPQGMPAPQRIDTHISTLVLAGEFAFKLKKPVDLGFLDFRSLDARRHFCEEELRLNRRTAPDIYLDVLAVTGSAEHPSLVGRGEPIDWALRMRRFDPRALLANRGEQLDPYTITLLAGEVAGLHRRAEQARDPGYGSPESVITPMRRNFEQLAGSGHEPALGGLADWTEAEFARLVPLIEQRRRDGHVRECHGDLHLGNIALIDGHPTLFDALEFDPALRWIDTINDLAFLVMDLHSIGRPELAFGFLDRYLDLSGDYPGLPLLRFYCVYRSLVRAKVAAIQLGQLAPESRLAGPLAQDLAAHIQLATRLSTPTRGGIVITHGPSGSGKSTVSAPLPWQLPLIRVRSDVERKRLMGIEVHQDAAELDGYSSRMHKLTFARLHQCARAIIESGLIALVDATFLHLSWRDPIRRLADEYSVPFVILDCVAPAEELRRRILERRSDKDNVSDAGLEVLEIQLVNSDPLHADEQSKAVLCTPDRKLDIDALKRHLA